MQRAWQKLTAPLHRTRLNELVILSMPRTGSSYLCDCLESLPRTLVLREIFNPRGYRALLDVDPAKRRFEALLGVNLDSRDDPALHRYFLDHPLEAVEMLADASLEQGATLMTYKVMHHQLERPSLEALLERRRPAVLILVRQRLDVWVSLMKAVAVGAWHRERTEDVSIEVDVDKFVAWAKAADDGYDFALHLVSGLGLRSLVLDYEGQIDRPPAELRSALVGWLAALHIKLPDGTARGRRPRERQDARTDPFSKISNGAAVRQQLIDRGLLDYALSPPLADRIARPT